MMRALIVSNMFPTNAVPNGGSFVARRARALERAGSEVQLWAYGSAPTEIDLDPLWRYSGVVSTKDRVFSRVSPDRLGAARVARRILQEAQPWSPDIVVSHGMFRPPAGTLGAKLARSLGVPHVVQLHGSDVNVVMAERPGPARRILQAADGVIYVSHALCSRAVALGVPAGPVIPNGVDLTVFSRNEGADRDMRILFVGNLIPVKGADRLPQLFSNIAAQIPRAEFTVIGDGPLRLELEQEMDSRGVRTEFLGSQPTERVAQAMRTHRLLVLPSRSEGWPCTVLEAHASGTLVVGTDVGGVAEAIGERRFVVDDGPDVVKRLADRVVLTLTEDSPFPTDQLVARAGGFSWDAVAERELAVFRLALQGSGA